MEENDHGSNILTFVKYYTACEKLKSRLGNINWGNITPKYLENKVRELNFKIVHGKIPTRAFLRKINCVGHNRCEWCPEQETIEHLFFECDKVTPLWSEVEKACNKVYHLNIKLNI